MNGSDWTYDEFGICRDPNYVPIVTTSLVEDSYGNGNSGEEIPSQVSSPKNRSGNSGAIAASVTIVLLLIITGVVITIIVFRKKLYRKKINEEFEMGE